METIIKPIRSFVRRERRLIQKSFPQTLWKRYGIDIEDFSTLATYCSQFNSVTLEIGFGVGDTLFAQASKNLKQAYIGIEVYKTGIKKLLLTLEKNPLNNLRLLEGDATQLLSKDILHNSLNAIQILFPDPWPKRRHHKRRLIQPDFLNVLYEKLKPGGLLYIATDHEHYAYHMLATLESSPFVNSAKSHAFSDKPAMLPFTKFEERGNRLGHSTWYLIFKKCI